MFHHMHDDHEPQTCSSTNEAASKACCNDIAEMGVDVLLLRRRALIMMVWHK